MKIFEEHRQKIDCIMYSKVVNIGLKRNAEDLLKWLGSISIALNLIQKDTCTNAEAVHTWKNLEMELKYVDISTFKNLQYAIQASTGSFPFCTLTSGSSL